MVSFTLILRKYSKSSVNTERLAPKYARQSPWLAFGICLILCGNFITQDLAYNAPDVNIYMNHQGWVLIYPTLMITYL